MKANLFSLLEISKKSANDTWNVFGLEGHCAECINNKLPKLYFAVIFLVARAEVNFFVDLSVLFCHLNYSVTTTATLKQCVSGTHCCICLLTVENNWWQNNLFHAHTFHFTQGSGAGTPLPTSAPFHSLFAALDEWHRVPGCRDKQLLRPFWRNHNKKTFHLPLLHYIRNKMQC